MGASSSTENRNRNRARTTTNQPAVVNQQRQVPPQQQPQQRTVTNQPPQQYPAQQRTVTQQQPQPVARPPPMQQQRTQTQQQNNGGVAETKTIKNLCTVNPDFKFDKENSLLRFSTTSTVDCNMEIFIGVRVDIRSGTALMTPNKPRPQCPPINVPANMSKQHEIYLDLVGVVDQEKTFLKQYPKQIPVAISLRYTNPEAAEAMRAIQGKYAGHQAEHTFVQLEPEAKMLRQLVEADGNIYNVEHLFGADNGGAVATAEVVDGADGSGAGLGPGGEVGGQIQANTDGMNEDDNMCVVCLTNEKDTAVIPCRHLCLCKECAGELRRHSQKCPVCRGPIQQLLAMKH